MSYKKSVVMLSNTGKEFNLVGEKIPTESFYGYSDGRQTVQIIYRNFTGGFGIQGTLALDPKDEDWFWIKLKNDLTLIKYPLDELNPTGAKNANVQYIGDTGSDSFTFSGNFTYLRAVVDREYLHPLPVPDIYDDIHLGSIDQVLINF
jgi:hypothetical protein